MLNDTEVDRWRHTALLVALLAGCGAPPTGGALVALPDLAVVTLPASAGAPVQLEVHNDTPDPVQFSPLPCVTSIERFRFGEWTEVVPVAEACIGIVITIPPGERHGYLAEMPPGPGRYRAILRGSAPAGAFVTRSPAFNVE